MSTAGVLLFLLSTVCFLCSLVLVFKRAHRRGAVKAMIGSVVGAVISFVLIGIGEAPNTEAKRLGFQDAADRAAASSAGYTDAAGWQNELQRRERVKALAERVEAEARQKQEAEAAARAAETKRAEEDRCRQDVKCIGENFLYKALGPCRRAVENLAKNDFQWVDGWTDAKLSRYRLKDVNRGIVTYVGDQIQYQNGLGNWIRHTYECDFDTKGSVVTDARAFPGRLPSR